MARCLIALGSNVGDRAEHLDRALEVLAAKGDIAVVAQSEWLETRPVGGPGGQPAFMNGAAVIETAISPPALLARLLEIEAQLGRRREVHWGPRTLDLDLLLYDQEILRTPELTIPHPGLAFRLFALIPAVEVAADWVHPTIGWPLLKLLERLAESPAYVAITGPPGGMQTRLAREAAAAVGGRFLTDPLAGTAPASSPQDIVERLDRRCQLLAKQVAEDNSDWTVSDFWIGEALAEARHLRTELVDKAFRKTWEHHVRSTPEPRLLITLEGSSGEPGCGPVLNLPAEPFERLLEQTVAAIGAMEM